MKEWFSLAELAAAQLPGLPATVKGFDKVVFREGWRMDASRCRKLTGREGGGGFQYHVSLLSDAARSKLAFIEAAPNIPQTAASNLLWRRFEALTDDQRAVCQKRLDVLTTWESMRAAGINAAQAARYCETKFDVARSSLYEWRQKVEGKPRQDWLAALAPDSATANGEDIKTAECHPDAWDVLASDYLRPEGPKFSSCYRRMKEVAKKKGWAPIPAERTLRRHMDIKVPRAVQILARKGKEEAMKLLPAQQRSVAHLAAMEYANTDGHKLDLHVMLPGRDKPTRVYLMATQDLYSRKILSWTLAEAETWEAVRTIIGRMVEDHGIPKRLYMDNGKAFASKKISGRAKRRNRFKITEDEVAGLLKTLGIDGRFVKPYSGQSKPIERGWGDLAEEISKHPDMAGAYTGRSPEHKPENYGEWAVPLDQLETHVADRIAEHNAREGRKTETAKGRSFDATFAASLAEPLNAPRFASPIQRSLWMLTAETIKARKPNGAVHLFGNRYWSRELNQWVGKKLTVRFDPSDLHGTVKVYDPQGRLICEAACIDKTGFDCQAAARETARAKSDFAKSLKVQKDAARRLSDLQLKELMGRGESDQATKAKPTRPKVTRLITRQQAAPATAVDEIDEQQFEDNFSRGLARLAGGDAAILPFPKGNRPVSTASGRKHRAE
ncbi:MULTISPECIES: transposase domain-containing protein [unclassified Shinella]|uniref:transposase domain-containing protein n=1 Tax=unclassified Shinella TaxID=2643062 RepID=UPI00225C7A66|nr:MULTISPECIES: transposase domain-containing protein [unclassified Shinella]MCO5139030.1 Mu transposase C-terminal domain-containing protein [Shinella sp.]MDC7256241.1 Mu transposase C-terminal domain-containing protein [Shinella sp. YE25]CAI0339098.1 transposase [Rhizobiaceae bacterium]CAK7257514.1 transposase [Shinella sp. WSC3-e]